MPQYIKKEGEVISLAPKYRLGKKNKRAIIEVATGHEYLIFPQSKTEHIQEFLNFLNGKESKPVEETNEAIEFAEWINSDKCDYIYMGAFSLGAWVDSNKCTGNDGELTRHSLILNHGITTAELYKIFKDSITRK